MILKSKFPIFSPEETKLASVKCWLLILASCFLALPAHSQVTSSNPKIRKILKDIDPLIPLTNQPYALCAGATTFNFDGITYARCQVMNGNSLASRHRFPGGDAKSVNAIGNSNNGFFLSTYSPPASANLPFAMYQCKGNGSFAQCNGGVCFTSTQGNTFPSFGKLAADQIICSCPIQSTKDYSVWGPSKCPKTRREYDAVCSVGTSKLTTKNGVSLRVGEIGPPAVMEAINYYYDKEFKPTTPSTLETCARP